MKRAILMAVAATCFLAAGQARAQEASLCGLGHVTERVTPRYPDMGGFQLVEGVVTLGTTFAPDGHVVQSKYLSGPKRLQFDAQSYVSGWRADKADAPRQCVVSIEYRFDGSQAVCSKRTTVAVRAERLDESHVMLHLSCDIW